MTKTLDRIVFFLLQQNDNIRSPISHQGIVSGTNTDLTTAIPGWSTASIYDGDYRTVLNRFLMQARDRAIASPVNAPGGQDPQAFHSRFRDFKSTV